MSLYERLAATPDGARALAKARARHDLLRALCWAVETAGGPAEFAKQAGIRVGRVRRVLNGDGNVRINLIADWLHAAGFEMEVRLVPAGQPRQDVLDRRAAYAQLKQERDDALDRIDYVRHEVNGWNSRDQRLKRLIREALGDPTWSGDGPMPEGKPRPKQTATQPQEQP